MSDSSKRFQQLQDLRWKELCKTCGFTGDHLKWHESPARRSSAARGGVSLLPPPLGSGVKFYGSKGEQISWKEWRRVMPPIWAERGNTPAVIDSIGISATVTLAKARYTSTAEDYLSLWAETNGDVDFTQILEAIRRLVMREVGDLWGDDKWHRDWFDRACRPKIEEALTPLVEAENSRTLRLKIQHLENPHLSLKRLVGAGGNLSLAFTFEQSDRAIEAAEQLLATVRDDPGKDRPIRTADGANAEQHLTLAPTMPHPSNSAPTATNGATPEPATPEAATIFLRDGDISKPPELPRNPRGRPAKILRPEKLAGIAAQERGVKGKELAKIVYKNPRPTNRQASDVGNVLKNFRKQHQPE